MFKKITVLFLFLLFSLSLFSSGLDEALDGLQYLAVARNIYYKHEPVYPVDEYGKQNGWKNIYMSSYVGRNGKTFGLTGLGFSLAMVPAVAVTDLVYKIYNVVPPVHFPLENDWLILLTSSFTNIFFASLMGVFIYLYLLEFKLKERTALWVTFLTIFTTNMFAFSKHITAHMMFSTFVLATFFFFKKFATTSNKKFLYFAGAAFGIMMITYNNTFLLPIIPIIIYYLLLTKPKIYHKSILPIAKDLLVFALGALPFFITYRWFEHFRAPEDIILSSPTFLFGFLKKRILTVPSTVFFEGLWGQIFSPGRSFFIYTPLALTIVFFWHKLTKKVTPEVIAFLTLGIIYIVFYAAQYLTGVPGQGFAGLWPGESSWGPRYLSPLIAPSMLLFGYIYTQLSKLQKIFFVIPLAAIGLYVEILGVTLPYQTKVNYLDRNFYVNNTEYNAYTYINLLPRYSPIIMQTKNLARLVLSLKNITNPGEYNVRMYDGISFAFDVGQERWRKIENKGYISFDNNPQSPIEHISFDVINHPVSNTKVPLAINFELNGKKVFSKPIVLKIGERKNINLPLLLPDIKETNNLLIVVADYGDEKVLKDEKQIPAIINIIINDKIINKEFIWVPYVSDLGPKLTNATYQNWGGTNPDKWNLWNLHTQTYERLPDFWWFRNLFYWDVPQRLFKTLLAINVAGIIFFGLKLKKLFNPSHPK